MGSPLLRSRLPDLCPVMAASRSSSGYQMATTHRDGAMEGPLRSEGERRGGKRGLTAHLMSTGGELARALQWLLWPSAWRREACCSRPPMDLMLIRVGAREASEAAPWPRGPAGRRRACVEHHRPLHKSKVPRCVPPWTAVRSRGRVKKGPQRAAQISTILLDPGAGTGQGTPPVCPPVGALHRRRDCVCVLELHTMPGCQRI